MMIGRGALAVLAVALLVGGAGCGGGASGVDTGDNSVIVIHLDIPASVPSIYQIEVDAHLGTGGRDSILYFPTTAQQQPIASGSTLGLLIKPSIMDILDLTVYGLDGMNHRLASGSSQVNPIVVGAINDTMVSLAACPASGC